MRLLSGVVGAAAFASVVGACAAISGLSSYSTSDCPAGGCDATTPPRGDATVGEDAPGADAPPGNDDADAGPGEDSESGGCAPGLLACAGGCADPSSASSCGACGNACEGDASLCANGDAGFACASSCPSSSPTACDGGQCVNTSNDPNNCGGCGSGHVCTGGAACVGGVCTMPSAEGGTDAGDAGVACPDGGCPSSTATGFSCPFGHCNGASSECATGGGCFCSNDNQCRSNKCVKVTGENDVSCGSNCTGSGGRDGFNCELASPGIPSLATGGVYMCPPNSGYGNSTLTCDSTHTNCYCTADSQCPSNKCIPSATNANCSPGGPCSGTGSADYRGCVPIAAIPNCPIYIGCPLNITVCQYPICYCTSDVACASGHCIPSSHNGNCAGCTGTGTDDGHGCQPAPSSVACTGSGGTVCTTTLTPAPVPNTGHTACLCVADSNCSSGKCLNADTQCTVSGSCTGSGSKDNEDCQTATSVANAWSCSIGNCDNVTSPSGQCTAAGVPCWCTSDAQCPGGARCSSWAGCASGSCTGTGTGNPFHCAP